jgi:molybdopterin-guanine dinucleotide biosynthesis protein A
MTTQTSMPPLYGLVLAGGRSRRMGRDKAALAYQDGVPHARRTADLLSEVCERVFVSCRADQVESIEDPALASLPASVTRIPDRFEVSGPLNGILSALAAHPNAAFLVVACDLPFLSAEALATLVARRDPAKAMTVFENPARDNFLEPLCAIYEPSYPDLARDAMTQGLTCPTKIANALDVERLIPNDALFLDNANTPEDYHRVVGRRMSDVGREENKPSESPHPTGSNDFTVDQKETSDIRHPTSDTITVEYFAIFRAQAKRSSEEIPLDGASLADLYERMRLRHGFALTRDSVHVAINDVYASWDAVLQPGDRLVFIPPVSGG